MYFNGALSLQPEGLRPITSLSTLDRHGCPYRPKTRYQVRWVTASWAALTAASKHSASWRTTCQYPCDTAPQAFHNDTNFLLARMPLACPATDLSERLLSTVFVLLLASTHRIPLSSYDEPQDSLIQSASSVQLVLTPNSSTTSACSHRTGGDGQHSEMVLQVDGQRLIADAGEFQLVVERRNAIGEHARVAAKDVVHRLVVDIVESRPA